MNRPVFSLCVRSARQSQKRLPVIVATLACPATSGLIFRCCALSCSTDPEAVVAGRTNPANAAVPDTGHGSLPVLRHSLPKNASTI